MNALPDAAPAALLRKAARHYRQGGVGRVLRIAARKAARTLLVANSAVWYRLECPAGLDLPPAPDGEAGALTFGLEAREAFEGWARANARRFPYIFDEREARRDRADDVSYYSLRDRDGVAAFVQVGRGRVFVRDYDRHVSLPAGAAFIQQVFCDPGRRGRGYGTFLVRRVVDELRQRGVGRVFCHIPAWNAASIALHRRVGFAPAGRVTYLRVLGLPLFTRHPDKLVRGDGHR